MKRSISFKKTIFVSNKTLKPDTMLNNTNEIKMENQPIDCLTVNKKVNTGLCESVLGLVNTKEEAKQKLSKWL